MLPQLDPSSFYSQLFWLTISLVFMHIVLARVLLPRLMRVIAGRETFKRVAIEEAENFKRGAEEAKNRYEAALHDARERSKRMFSDAEITIKNTTNEAQKQLDSKVLTLAKEAEANLSVKAETLKKQLQENASDLVADVVERFSGARPDAGKSGSALNQSIQGVK